VTKQDKDESAALLSEVETGLRQILDGQRVSAHDLTLALKGDEMEKRDKGELPEELL
jgi:hypothetical protein